MRRNDMFQHCQRIIQEDANTDLNSMIDNIAGFQSNPKLTEKNRSTISGHFHGPHCYIFVDSEQISLNSNIGFYDFWIFSV